MKMRKMGAAQSVTVTSASEMIVPYDVSASPALSGGLSARRMRAPATLMPPPAPPPSAAATKPVQPGVKVAAALAALAARAKAGTAPTPDDLRFLRDGKVSVRLWLEDASGAALAQLGALGFEVTAKPDAARVVIGRIAVARLDALSQLACVRYVEGWEARR